MSQHHAIPAHTPAPVPFQDPSEDQLHQLMRLWLLRILVPLNAYRNLVSFRGTWHADKVTDLIGLPGHFDFDERPPESPALLRSIRKLHQQAEAAFQAGETTDWVNLLPAVMKDNLRQCAALLSLNPTEQRLLAWCVIAATEPVMEEASDLLADVPPRKLAPVMSTLLDVPVEDMKAALSPRGRLTDSGLLTVQMSSSGLTLTSTLTLSVEEFAGRFTSERFDVNSLILEMARPAPAPQLALHDYTHLQDVVDVAIAFLRHALDTKSAGVNLLLFGPPGTGKTQLSRLLAVVLGVKLFQLDSERYDRRPDTGDCRLSNLRLAQHMLGRAKTLLLMDDADDVFEGASPLVGAMSIAQRSKNWLNRTLEDNRVPTIWVVNNVESVDRAFVRRFSMAIDVPVPPRSQRERIIREQVGNVASDQTVSCLADHHRLSPAVVTQARDVVQRSETSEPDRTLIRLVNSTLLAQSHRPLSVNGGYRLPSFYDLAHVNTDADLQRLGEGLVRHRRARLCLYGLPGTGKTAYAHWLAKKLDMPLMQRRASDLMSPFMGVTEHLIATAFSEAEQDGALLLIDEADSFLRSRERAQTTWEVSQVNEMLTRMEEYSGVFIACTNLIGDLDAAALRRFDRKVHFDCLAPSQAWELLHRFCEQLELPAPEDADWLEIAALDTLTPGDFNTIARRHQFEPVYDVGEVIAALRSEHQLRGAMHEQV